MGMNAGSGKCGLPPIFKGQSLVKTQPIAPKAIVVPVIP